MSRDLRKVSVLVLSWNGREHLETCLPELRRQDDPQVDWEVLVLDNGSKDDTVAWVRAEHPWVRLVESPSNLGFAGGNNRLAREASGDALVFLNNDTRPRRDWLAQLVAVYRGAPDDVAAVSGRIHSWDGEDLDFGYGVMTFDGHAFQLDFRRPLTRARVPSEGEELFFPCGGNTLVRRSSFDDAGGFDADYFAYLEDVDLGWRLWAGGERVVAAPGAIVHHRSSATSDLLGLYNRGFLFERNAFLTVHKNLEPGLWERLMPAVMLTYTSRTQTYLVQNNPNGELLTLDPYAGHIADTAAPTTPSEVSGTSRDDSISEVSGTSPEVSGTSGIVEKWRVWGPREFFARALGKARRSLGAAIAGSPGGAVPVTVLTDDRTVAQLRATTYLLAHLESNAAKRAAVQARRRRSDREIFERFPLYVVPTYPGDETLFASAAFRDWLPDDLPFEHRRLEEVMAVAP
jgi:GT2 family glycosyltransferase